MEEKPGRKQNTVERVKVLEACLREIAAITMPRSAVHLLAIKTLKGETYAWLKGKHE